MRRNDSTGPGIDEQWFTPGVRGIGAASLLADVGHEIPTSLLPSFLTSTLGAPASALGLIEGVSDGLAGVARLGGGALADDPERRRAAAVGGYTATAVLAGLVGAASATWQVALLRAGAWTARGLRVPSRNALLADAVEARAYGRAYGFERAMDNIGAIVGPLLALALVSVAGVRTTMLLSIVPGLLAVLAILYAIRRTPFSRPRERTPIRIKVRPVLRGRLGRLFIGVGVFEFGNVAATLLILRATDLLARDHGIDDATRVAIALYVAYNVFGALSSFVAGHAGDRFGTVRMLAGGVGAFALAYAGFAVTGASVPVLAACFAIAGIGIGCVETAEHAAVAALSPAAIRGSAFGLLAAVQSVGNLCASGIAGIVYAAWSPAAAFAIAASLMAVSLVTLVATMRRR